MRTTALRRAAMSAAGAAIALAVAGPLTSHAQDDVFRFGATTSGPTMPGPSPRSGPAEAAPADGAVEGWRYAVAGAEPRFPRADGDFELICGSTDADAGEKRVAVVIDYGTDADSEDGSNPGRGGCLRRGGRRCDRSRRPRRRHGGPGGRQRPHLWAGRLPAAGLRRSREHAGARGPRGQRRARPAAGGDPGRCRRRRRRRGRRRDPGRTARGHRSGRRGRRRSRGAGRGSTTG